MSIEGLIVSVILLTLVALWVAAPLLRTDTRQKADEAHLQKQRERLLIYYERVLTNLRDLDEDYSTGKMPEGDYALEREEWVQRGIQVLKALDMLDEHTFIDSPPADDVAVDEAIDHAIEAAIAARRQGLGQQTSQV